jgi:hypothetical protein
MLHFSLFPFLVVALNGSDLRQKNVYFYGASAFYPTKKRAAGAALRI